MGPSWWSGFAAELVKLGGLPQEEPAPRTRVPGLKQPRIATPRLNPELNAGGPSNPFRGNWQKLSSAETPTLEDRAKDVGLGALEVGATGRLGRRGAERLLGVQRFVHGTSEPAAASILREGLDPAHGGSPVGGGAAIGADRYVNSSRGKVHVAPDSINGRTAARAHASLAQAAAEAQARGVKLDQVDALRHYFGGIMGTSRKGRILGGVMPFDEFKAKFEGDPDMPGAFRSSHPVGPERLQVGRVGLREMWAARPQDLLHYAQNNKARVLAGAGYAGASVLSLADGVRRLYGAVHPGAQHADDLGKVASELTPGQQLALGAATIGAGLYTLKRTASQLTDPRPAGVGAGAGARTVQRVLLPGTSRAQVEPPYASPY